MFQAIDEADKSHTYEDTEQTNHGRMYEIKGKPIKNITKNTNHPTKNSNMADIVVITNKSTF